jgi:hypothetical protein
MTFIKRGLGRGLEVLLADVSGLTGIEQASATNEMDERLAVAQQMIENLQSENRELLSEVELLKSLLDELESIIRADIS